MKYFTPELHARTCSAKDAVADAAHTQWEVALDRYEKRLRQIHPVLTPGLRQLVDKTRLHDSELVFLGRSGDRCYLMLRAESPPRTITSLEYDLAADPLVETNVLPPELQTSGCFFLYDEVDVAVRNGRHVFSHSILFTNGLHLRIRFHDVKITAIDLLVQVSQISKPEAVRQPA